MTTYFPFQRRTALRVSTAAAVAVLGLFSIAPAVAVLVISFTNIRGLPYLPVSWVGVENYIAFFSPARWDYNFNALRNTLLFSLATTLLSTALALLIAVLLNTKLRGTNLYRAVVFMPTVLGVTVIGLIWSLFFNPSAGPAASLWGLFGADSAFFGDQRLALGLVIFVSVWAGLGVAMVIFLTGLQAIPEELYEVAAIDGASAVQTFRFVTVPMLAPSITANVLLSIIGSLQSYQLAYVLTGPANPATQLLSLAIFSQGFGAGNPGVSQSQGYAASISIIQFVIVGVVSLLALAYLRKREDRL